jgi:hypothetical protein
MSIYIDKIKINKDIFIYIYITLLIRRVIIGKYTKNKPVNIIYQEDTQRIIMKRVIILRFSLHLVTLFFELQIFLSDCFLYTHIE